MEYPRSTPGVPLEYPWNTLRVSPCHSPTLVCAQRPPVTRVHGCRNTALHVAASSKRANGRAAMVAFLIAERADVSKANKQGCAQRSSERGGPRPRRAVLSCSAQRRRLAIVGRC
jgi:hypothetical protein